MKFMVIVVIVSICTYSTHTNTQFLSHKNERKSGMDGWMEEERNRMKKRKRPSHIVANC